MIAKYGGTMRDMRYALIALAWLVSSLPVWAVDDPPASYPSYDYEAARAHEIKPHRRTIPMEGVDHGFNQLRLRLIVSPEGSVLNAEASGSEKPMALWPQLKTEVSSWKFKPFEMNGIPVTAQVEEYIDLAPPERLPKIHAAARVIRADSKIVITLSRSGCYGMCPSYSVDVRTEGIVFDGRSYVVAIGKHMARANPDAVRALAQKFIDADFYSMEPGYYASVTDSSTYALEITIDGHEKRVADYVGSWVGMPAVISELEDEVDSVAETERWIKGRRGLAQALQAEKFDFHTFEALRGSGCPLRGE